MINNNKTNRKFLIVLMTWGFLNAFFSQAATIIVNGTDGSIAVDGVCSISEAIQAANTDSAVNECPAGNNEDTINLLNDITLTDSYNNEPQFGKRGVPVIESSIIVNGGGFNLQRDNSMGCVIDNSDRDDEFGLIWISSTGSLSVLNLTLMHGCLDNNQGVVNYGGAIYNEGLLSLVSSHLISNSSSIIGGAIYNHGSATITNIENTTFSNNSAAIHGGVIFNNSTIDTILNSSFMDNSTLGYGGGVFSNGSSSIIAIQNSTFSNNSAGSFGGAIFSNGTMATIENSTFSGNTADNGGAINFNGGAIVTSVHNNTFAGNTAVFDGGAIRTFANLSSLNNTLFVNNSAGISASDFDDNSSSTNGNNNLSDNLSGGSPGLLAIALNSNTVGPLANNGGPTFTHALLIGSEAINASDAGTNTDQRGFAAFEERDIGAFETHPPVVVAPSDILVEATGLLTNPDLGSATVIDVDETGLIATASQTTGFELGMTTVTWSVTDSQGFMSTDTNVVNVIDSTAPLLTLIGDDPISLTVGDTYVDAGAIATDLVDDDTVLTNSIVTSNLPNLNAAGNYVINYDVSDSAGNPATTIIRTVNVLATVGGSITGLATDNSVEIQNNGGDNLVLNMDGDFTFITPLALNAKYSVTVLNQPTTPSQSCIVSEASGSITSDNITSVAITCNTYTYIIGGIVSGLLVDNYMVLQNNDSNDLTITSNGAYIFSTPIIADQGYDVQIFLDAINPIQPCSIENNSGTVTDMDVFDVNILCEVGTDLIFRNGFEIK